MSKVTDWKPTTVLKMDPLTYIFHLLMTRISFRELRLVFPTATNNTSTIFQLGRLKFNKLFNFFIFLYSISHSNYLKNIINIVLSKISINYHLYFPKTEKQQFSKQWSETTLKYSTNHCVHCKKSRQYLQ